jgi:hypothetical protein
VISDWGAVKDTLLDYEFDLGNFTIELDDKEVKNLDALNKAFNVKPSKKSYSDYKESIDEVMSGSRLYSDLSIAGEALYNVIVELIKSNDSNDSSQVYQIEAVRNLAEITGLEPGYYLIKDKDSSLTGDEAYTEYILNIVADTTITPKTDVPSVEKKVKDTNDTTGDTTEWQDSADYDIGDVVPFQLTDRNAYDDNCRTQIADCNNYYERNKHSKHLYQT